MRKRDYRRWRYHLKKNYWLKRIRSEEEEFNFWPSKEEKEKSLIFRSRFHATTACNCSCYLCGNPRKHRGELTQQEKKSNISYQLTLRSDE